MAGRVGRPRGRLAEGYGLVIVAASCWAAGGLLAKWLFTAPGPATESWTFPPLGIAIDPQLLSAARAMVSLVVVVVYLAIAKRHHLVVRARQLPFLALFGVGMALMHFTYFKTISLTGVATAILLEYLAPIIVLVVSVTLLGEKLTLALPAAVALSVAGCALMVGAIGNGGFSVSAEGVAWGLSSAVFFAGYALMGRYAAGRYSAWTLLAYGLSVASIFWMIVLGGPGPVVTLLGDPRALIAMLMLAVFGTVIPFGAFLTALTLIEATKASVTSTVEPVIAGVVAWYLFAERLDALQLVGGALVVVAVVLSQVRVPVAPEGPPGLEG